MRDMLPDEHNVASFLKKVIRYRCRQAGIRRITTPIFERPVILDSLPQAKWGERVLFNVAEGKSNELVLRSGFMWGIWRAYITHKMSEKPQPQELYALDLCFATEWQQEQLLVKQFLGFDIEIIGEEDPALDAQILKLWQTICSDIGIVNCLTVKLSKIGDVEARQKFAGEIEQYYLGKERSLCSVCKGNLIEKKFFSLLSCPEEDCQILAKLAPRLEKYFSPDLKEFYQNIEEYLEALEVKYEWQDYLFSDTYSFFQPLYGEIYLDQKKVGHIGHYQNILAVDEENSIAGRSFCLNLDEVIKVMQEKNVFVPFKDNIHVYVAQLGPEAKKKGMALLYQLRDQGIKVIGSMGKGSMQEQVDIAYKFRIPYCVLLGRMEVNEDIVLVRDMKTGKRQTVPMNQINDYLLERIPAEELDKVHPDSAKRSALFYHQGE
ncbi:MAG: ATP phosphoribosyltransferase regulatory subunit [Candidatus Abawacabacteria bacterium]|nr:ATP phosphoribosyltransferase regulatory subunit [Candidatus Abawacabacteria bacterium]